MEFQTYVKQFYFVIAVIFVPVSFASAQERVKLAVRTEVQGQLHTDDEEAVETINMYHFYSLEKGIERRIILKGTNSKSTVEDYQKTLEALTRSPKCLELEKDPNPGLNGMSQYYLIATLQDQECPGLKEAKVINFKEEMKTSVVEAVQRLLKNHEFVFIAENHWVYDEKILVDNLESFVNAGMTTIGIEFHETETEAINEFMKTGSVALFNSPFDIFMSPEMPYRLLLEKARELHLRVVPYDISDHFTPEKRAERELLMAKQVELLPKEGKKLIFCGHDHAELSKIPYWSMRTLVSNSRSTAALDLESIGGIVAVGKETKNMEYGLRTYSAYSKYLELTFHPPSESFAYPTSGLSTLTFLPMDLTSKTFSYYQDNFDYVVLLTNEDAPLIDFSIQAKQDSTQQR